MPPKDQDRADELPAVEVRRPTARAPLVLACEHASNRFPTCFGALGIAADVIKSHVAWDPGALAVAQGLSERLDAPLVASTVSRLVYDCNRPSESPGAMPAKSELFDIPGNRNLDEAARSMRVEMVYKPFCAALMAQIKRAPRPKALITIHSFTPVYMGRRRLTEIGILHDKDSRLADAMLAGADRYAMVRVERNKPYGPEDGVTHTLQEHGLKNGLHNVMLEIRNDLIATQQQQDAMADMLTRWLTQALGALDIDVTRSASDRLGERKC